MRVILAKTGHGPHSSKIVVLFYVLFVCKCVLYYCHRVTRKLQLTNISYTTYPCPIHRGLRRDSIIYPSSPLCPISCCCCTVDGCTARGDVFYQRQEFKIFTSRAIKVEFLFPSMFGPSLGPTQHPIPWVAIAFPPTVKRSAREAHNSPPEVSMLRLSGSIVLRYFLTYPLTYLLHGAESFLRS